MTRIEYDVYLCTLDPSGPVAANVAAGLSRLGFRVCAPDRGAGALSDAERLAIIADTSDFVVVTEEVPSFHAAASPSDAWDVEIGQAIRTGRNLLWLAVQSESAPEPSPPSPRLVHLKPWQYVAYDPARSREAVAILSHRLLSSQDVEDRHVMRRAKQATIAAALVLVAVLAGLAIPPLVKAWNRPTPLPPLPPFEIHWAGFGQRLEAGRWSAFRLQNGVGVAAGDQFRLRFTPGSDGFAYVIATDVNGGVRVLFPATALRGVSRVTAGQSYDVPGRDRWTTVNDGAGLAGLFLVASHDSLENLEELAEEPDGEGHPKARLELLALTLDGLLDGRHAAVPSRVSTRTGQVILTNLSGAAAPPNASVMLADGTRVVFPLASERGLVGAAVEIRVRYEPAP